MSPFSNYLLNIRNKYGVSQRQLAAKMGYEQAYISGLELDKKGPPNDEFLRKLIKALGLNAIDAALAYETAERSQRRFVMPSEATVEQYYMIYELWPQLGHLLPAQVSMIRNVLELPLQITPVMVD